MATLYAILGIILYIGFMEEIYKPIESFDGYEISNLANVKSIKFEKHRILKQNNCNRYSQVRLMNGGKKYSRNIHKLVWVAFNGQVPDGFVIDHKDNDRRNNGLSNLRIITQSQNLVAYHRRIGNRGTIGKSGNRYSARVSMNGKRVYLGIFDTHEMAREEIKKYDYETFKI